MEQEEKKSKVPAVIWRRFILIIVGVILGVNVYLANAHTIVGNQLPMPFGYGLANVLSGSMEPTFSKGTLLLVKKEQEYKTGDIVVYQSGQELIVHRIIELDGDTVVTQGDANNVADQPFAKEEIKGVVIGWVPLLGSVSSVLKTPAGILLVLIAAFLLIEGSYRKQRENDDEELEAIKEEIRRLKAEQEETEEKEEREDDKEM